MASHPEPFASFRRGVPRMEHAVGKEVETGIGWFGLRSGLGVVRRAIRAEVGSITRNQCRSQVDQKGYGRISEGASANS